MTTPSVRLTEAEVRELERKHSHLGTLEYRDGETNMGTIIMSMPAPHGREFCRISGDSAQQYANAETVVAIINAFPAVLAERREREATLAEQISIAVQVGVLHQQAEAKLARVRLLRDEIRDQYTSDTAEIIGDEEILERLDEALADTPRSAAGDA